MIGSHYIHLIKTDSNAFFFIAEYMYHSFLIHSSADGHLGWFHILAIVNGALINNIMIDISIHFKLITMICLVIVTVPKYFYLFIYFNWRLITLQYCGGFCCTLT